MSPLARAALEPFPPLRPALRLAVAGYDLRFIAPVAGRLAGAGVILREDRWLWHDEHDEARSHEILQWAESVLCEWCLGNAAWYARHRRRGQRVIVHFHRFEIGTSYPPLVPPQGVDWFVFAGPHFREQAIAQFGWPSERCVTIPNPVDAAPYDRPKIPGAEWTLGLLGYQRRLKRLDLALDLLEILRRDEPRFRLRVAGASPRERPTIWRDRTEREYFERQEDRIRTTPLLRDAVTVEPFVDDVATWLDRVGFILSPSDVESFHLALAEGMASRAVPVIRRRNGVERLFLSEWVRDDAAGMAALVRDVSREGRWAEEGERARRYIDVQYGLGRVADAWRRVLGA